MSPAYRIFSKVFGNTMNSHEFFMDRLKSNANLLEVSSENDCDVLISFVPIVSRAGTDIQAALEKIPKHSYKHIILVVLHHTFDPDFIAPDSRYSVNRNDVFAVDCLYYEDQGLLNCKNNDEALERVRTHLGVKTQQSKDSDIFCPPVEKNPERTYWILAVIIIFLVYLVLPEHYSFFTFLIFEIFLLIIILVPQTHYYSQRRIWAVCIFIFINVLLFFKFLIQTPVTEQQD
ncbi:uncharacterized protein LOC128518578 isoform X2 [Clarias gariepinus]|uniref:uncharacterized protein LOC128518578 isoform X2 n=1 Tax=Clarias gariepinus TaxID=13013 RepID=UPI00234DDD16|nr:uncharacterized protein LOC128518578 isoform X2 [Clarias gariepinus]